MTDTPEIIAMDWTPGAAVTSGPIFETRTRWVRDDVAQAMVAAAYRREDGFMSNQEFADARAALDQLIAEAVAEQRARADAAEAERDRLRDAARATALPGNMHWEVNDPEIPLEYWGTPIDARWDAAGTVYEIAAAVRLPNIFVTERALTVDEYGDPDETEAAWFTTEAEAKACYLDSLAEARADAADTQEGQDND